MLTPILNSSIHPEQFGIAAYHLNSSSIPNTAVHHWSLPKTISFSSSLLSFLLSSFSSPASVLCSFSNTAVNCFWSFALEPKPRSTVAKNEGRLCMRRTALRLSNKRKEEARKVKQGTNAGSAQFVQISR